MTNPPLTRWFGKTRRQLRAEIAELEADAAKASEALGQLKLVKAGYEPDHAFAIQLASDVWPLIAASLVAWFDDKGGKNYVEMKWEDGAKQSSLKFNSVRGLFVITMQRLAGKTPHEFLEEAKAEVARLTEELARWKICENCGGVLDGPGICGHAISEKEKGLELMHAETLDRAEKAEAEISRLQSALASVTQERDEAKKICHKYYEMIMRFSKS